MFLNLSSKAGKVLKANAFKFNINFFVFKINLFYRKPNEDARRQRH